MFAGLGTAYTVTLGDELMRYGVL